MKGRKKANIGIVTPSVSKVTEMFLQSRMQVLKAVCNEVLLISPNLSSATSDTRAKAGVAVVGSIFTKIISYTLEELGISINLVRMSNRIDIVLLTIAGGSFLLPQLTAKLLGKKIVFLRGGDTADTYRAGYRRSASSLSRIIGGIVYPFIYRSLEKINHKLADVVAIYSARQIEPMNLSHCQNKVYVLRSSRFVDTRLFKVSKEISQRNKVIGYIGRFAGEKGITNFVKAIPLILKERDDVTFLLGGDGPLFDEIQREVKASPYCDKVTTTGWLPHEKLPVYLNELSLLVQPSFTEGLGVILLEAMACGTPVLATPEGAVPDVVKDGKTGFILKSNSPEHIAEGVIRTLQFKGLPGIVEKGRKVVEKEYTYDATVARYEKMLDMLNLKGNSR